MAQEPDELSAEDKLAQLKMESEKQAAEAAAAEAAGGAPEPQVKETRDDGNLVWDDGVVTDPEGNEIGAQVEPVVTARVEPRARTERKEEHRTATQTGPPIYTRDATRDAIYNDDVLAKIEEIAIYDRPEAERMRAKLQTDLSDALDRLRVHARKTFNAQLADYAQSAPEVVKRFRDEITEARDSLSPEQMQAPGMAADVVGRVMTAHFAKDPLDAEEAYMRFVKGRGDTPKLDDTLPKPPVKRTVIAPTDRTPGPGTAARREPTRRAAPNTRDSLAEKYRARYPKDLYPDVTDEECVQWADSMRQIEAEGRRTGRGA